MAYSITEKTPEELYLDAPESLLRYGFFEAEAYAQIARHIQACHYMATGKSSAYSYTPTYSEEDMYLFDLGENQFPDAEDFIAAYEDITGVTKFLAKCDVMMRELFSTPDFVYPYQASSREWHWGTWDSEEEVPVESDIEFVGADFWSALYLGGALEPHPDIALRERWRNYSVGIFQSELINDMRLLFAEYDVSTDRLRVRVEQTIKKASFEIDQASEQADGYTYHLAGYQLPAIVYLPAIVDGAVVTRTTSPRPYYDTINRVFKMTDKDIYVAGPPGYPGTYPIEAWKTYGIIDVPTYNAFKHVVELTTEFTTHETMQGLWYDVSAYNEHKFYLWSSVSPVTLKSSTAWPTLSRTVDKPNANGMWPLWDELQIDASDFVSNTNPIPIGVNGAPGVTTGSITYRSDYLTIERLNTGDWDDDDVYELIQIFQGGVPPVVLLEIDKNSASTIYWINSETPTETEYIEDMHIELPDSYDFFYGRQLGFYAYPDDDFSRYEIENVYMGYGTYQTQVSGPPVDVDKIDTSTLVYRSGVSDTIQIPCLKTGYTNGGFMIRQKP